MDNKKTQQLKRLAGEQADALARRLFGLPMGSDPESADVLRYFFEHELQWPKGIVPDDVEELELPSVPELFRVFRDRALGERPTGVWTIRRRAQKTPPVAPKRRL